jgi:hypothetical protein
MGGNTCRILAIKHFKDPTLKTGNELAHCLLQWLDFWFDIGFLSGCQVKEFHSDYNSLLIPESGWQPMYLSACYSFICQ